MAQKSSSRARKSSSSRSSGARSSSSRSARSSSSRSKPGARRSAGSRGKASASSRSGSRGSSSRTASARGTSSRSSRTTRGASSRGRSGAGSSSRSRVLTGHEEIRQWAEEREAQPACVRGTGGGEDVGMIRLDFPGFSGEQSLEPIEWEEWLQKFDENGLALLVQDQTAGGERSNFNKLVSRKTAAGAGKRSSRGARGSSRRKAA